MPQFRSEDDLNVSLLQDAFKRTQQRLLCKAVPAISPLFTPTPMGQPKSKHKADLNGLIKHHTVHWTFLHKCNVSMPGRQKESFLTKHGDREEVNYKMEPGRMIVLLWKRQSQHQTICLFRYLPIRHWFLPKIQHCSSH